MTEAKNVLAIELLHPDGQALLDLNYKEDYAAEVDLNVVCMSDGRFIEVQGSAEGSPFTEEQFQEMLGMAKRSCEEIHQLQKQVLGL